MRIALCHYSFHRSWKEGHWDARRLAAEAADLGVDGIDFHAGLLGDARNAVASIQAALDASGLILSGLSLSNNFNQADRAALQAQVDTVRTWLDVAAAVEAPVCRIFGGHVANRADMQARREGTTRILEALRLVVPEAAQRGLVLALENHGGLPCTGEEQVEVIETIGSPALRATVDVGNYMQGGQEGAEGARIAAPYAGYVHVKDFTKVPSDKTPWGWGIQSCTVGDGDVDLAACLRAIRDAGYDDFLALEYEGPEAEETGVPASLSYLRSVLQDL